MLLPLALLAAMSLYATSPNFAVWKTSRKTRRHRPIPATRPVEHVAANDCTDYKLLYYKLHNLELHPDILPGAKSLLLSFLSEALQCERHITKSTILELNIFTDVALNDFVQQELDAVTSEWHHYLARRKAGNPRELLPTADEARAWLLKITPLKFVDGAWLGHVHRMATSFATRKITKAAWQVLSEELGDGDLQKCHTYVYARLLEKIGISVPAPDSSEFMQHDGMNDVTVWRSALAQLLISLSPQEFLPEILGFSLHFEMLTLETLVVARELRELDIDPYYFTLHITIDNADTGHTAMASRIVTDYLKLVAEMRGNAAVDQEWKRIQAGYILSKNIGREELKDILGTKVLETFRAKSVACNRIHDHCPMSIKGRPLGMWLDPASFSRRDWQMDFLRCLADAKPWVLKGDSSRSRLMQQLAWGGRMFGAFTDREVGIVRDWIDSLAPPGSKTYTSFTGRIDLGRSIQLGQSHRRCLANPDVLGRDAPDADADADALRPLAADLRKLDIQKLLPIWFAHASLLEAFVSVPWPVANPTGCAVVRLLRAQYGFLPEPTGVHGVDEMSRTNHVDLVSIGCELISAVDPGRASPENMDDVLEQWPSSFAEGMLAAATKPRELQWRLLGMTHAFVQLHELLASSDALLFEPTRAALDAMRRREQESLAALMAGLRPGSLAYRDFANGCALAAREIKSCCK